MKRILVFFAALLLLIADSDVATSQCAMCRRNVETNKENGNNSNKVGVGLNKGILYLMAVPYVIGAIGIAMWMKHRKQQS